MSWIYAGEGKCSYAIYEEMKLRYRRGHDLKCIDGKYTASCKCTGFCTFEKHEGFVSHKLMEEHHCEDRECRYFLSKPVKIRTIKR